jgi:4-hydroxyphenylacetate 3-monooxygenase
MPVRTGQEYLAGLRDGRAVWYAGERVSDVSAHPALRQAAQSIARLYDLQHEPDLKEIMTYPSPTSGEPVGLSFIMPRRVEDLVRRRRMMKVWADATCGMMGRTPDFLNVSIMGFAAHRDFFAQCAPRCGDNIWRYYEYVRERDLCLTHTLVPPQIDRSKAASQQADPYLVLGVVRETSDGVIVRGARMLATLAPFADEIAVYPSTFRGFQGDEQRYAIMFAIPVATPGLTFICREGFDLNRPPWDHPLGARFDEMDCVAIFEDVLVPWERIFLYNNVELYNRTFAATRHLSHVGHQIAVKAIAKTEFVLGVACLLAETIGIQEFLHVQEKLGELITYLETIKACVRAAEVDATPNALGVLEPAQDPLHTVRLMYPSWYPRMIEILQILGAGGFMLTPSQRDLASPIGPLIDKYYQGANASGADRVKLFKLAWDLVGDAIGSRQVLYERFFSGDPIRNMALRYVSYDKSTAMAKVRAFLASYD